ncbi:hypothetical protein K457DRAFT_1867105 [Linnemannia elongata AG-77]|uniref:Uncharacterized protein n=1 Tax=Linnemannia elongata AG-77 TaxID=1314771 RepID=A0A197JJR6_9FUNG|nr:hypothetical protein K457DRAFT_1867105 [Linnemannia elongata AG-77]
MFDSPEHCPDYKDVKVVGVDLGEKISFCTTRVGPKEGERTPETEGRRETVSIRRNFLYKPSTAFRQQYQRRMQDEGVDLILSRMPSLELGGVALYIQYTANYREAIREFYHGSWFMKHSWEASKAQTACYDYAIKAVLGLVGGSEGRKHKENEGPAPVFALGLGSFDTQTGLPSKHPKLEKLFIRKLKSGTRRDPTSTSQQTIYECLDTLYTIIALLLTVASAFSASLFSKTCRSFS